MHQLIIYTMYIADIDGTITRSDVMGHFAALLSKDWTHVGVADLFTSIEKNGYTFLYLSSRSISHAELTRGGEDYFISASACQLYYM